MRFQSSGVFTFTWVESDKTMAPVYSEVFTSHLYILKPGSHVPTSKFGLKFGPLKFYIVSMVTG